MPPAGSSRSRIRNIPLRSPGGLGDWFRGMRGNFLYAVILLNVIINSTISYKAVFGKLKKSKFGQFGVYKREKRFIK